MKEYYERTKNSGPDRLTFKPPFRWVPSDPKPGQRDWVQVPLPSPRLSLSLSRPATDYRSTDYRSPATLSLEPRGNGLRIAVIGGGPAGLFVAIGAALMGHDVTVLERMEDPRVRGTINRDRSYPVDVTARGMAALGRLDGMLEQGSALHKRTLPFYGHGSKDGGPGHRLAVQGVVGTRDDVVLGMIEFMEENVEKWPGSVEVHCEFEGFAGVDLASRTLQIRGQAPDWAMGAWDLVVACDGKNSKTRHSAASQDSAMVVSDVFGRAGEQTYKAFNLENCQVPGTWDFAEGWLYGHPESHVVARMPGGGGVGIIPVDPAAVANGVPPGLLQQRVPHLLQYITMEERRAFELRTWSNAAGGFTVSCLDAGGLVALVGDAACSPPPPGQGINHVRSLKTDDFPLK